MQPRARAVLVVGAIAIASAIAGAAVDRSLVVRRAHHGGRPGAATPAQDARRRADMLSRMERDLSLTAPQRVAVDSIFQHTDSALRGIRREMQPRVRQILEQSRGEIAARLDTAQRRRFLEESAKRDSARAALRP